MGKSKWLGSLNHLIDMKCSVMIERSWVGTSIRLNMVVLVLLSDLNLIW